MILMGEYNVGVPRLCIRDYARMMSNVGASMRKLLQVREDVFVAIHQL